MLFPAAPTPDALSTAQWKDIEPFYRALVEFPLDPSSLRAWLDRWSALDESVDEAYTLALIAYTGDTRDREREAAYLRWGTEINPALHEIEVELGRRLIPFAAEAPDLELVVKRLRTDIEIFRPENLPRMAELEEMEAGYDKVTGGLTVQWDGTQKTIPELNPFLFDRDRSIRERAFRTAANAYLERRDELAALFDRMVRVRDALAREAGFRNYRDYAFAANYRFDYTPDDCLRFHAAVESAVLPAMARMHESRRARLGLDTLRPWDLDVDPTRTTPLKPFRTTEEFLGGASRMFDTLDGELGEFFHTMMAEHLLDLESRVGKAPGGYCARLARRGRPFIFMNAVGVHDDINTLVHESGHAFHTFLTRTIPYTWSRSSGHEAAELASMSMELLAARNLAAPVGFYSARDAADAEIEHLEGVLAVFPHVACVDAFQHWVYVEGLDATPAERDAHWLALRARFEPTVNYEGLESERIARWYRQSHIHTAPFYYIEYGIAQLGALQVWQRSQRDTGDALRRYKTALSHGGMKSLPEVYAAAGATLVFDHATMAPLIAAVEQRLTDLRSSA